MVMSRRSLLAAVPGLALFGQDQEPTFKAGVRVVQVLAAVRTKKGEIIRDLTKDDFDLAENNRPQTISYFSQQSDLPLTIGLMIDTSMSQRKVLEAERDASVGFLDDVLRPDKDQVFVMQFDTEVRTVAMLTSSKEKLGEALTYVSMPSRQQLEASRTGAGTLLYDSVETAAKDIMARVTGRKAVIVLTDGVDVGSTGSLTVCVDACQRADTLIYGIYFTDSSFYSFGGSPVNGRSVLSRMAGETGGGFFEVTKKRSIGDIYRAIQEELRSQYNIGYVSNIPVNINEFRRIQLTCKRKDLIVQARDRYWVSVR
jgi:VWFA-related protein